MQAFTNFAEQVASIASRDDKLAARNLLASHPPPADIETLDSNELRVWADVAYTAHQDATALRLYSLLAAKEPQFFWPFFQLGRVRLRTEDFAAAADALTAAVALDPQFTWAWYELGRCLLKLGDSERLGHAVRGFAAARGVQLTAQHANVLVAIAHHLFERKLREEPFQIYAMLIEQGFADDLVRTRHAEYFIWKREFETAVGLLDPLWRDGNLGDWGCRSLAQAYGELGQLEKACEILENITTRNPRNFQFLRDYIELLCERGLHDRAKESYENARSELVPKKSEDLHVVLLGGSNSYAELLTLLSAEPDYGTSTIRNVLDRVILNCAYKAKDYNAAVALIDFRTARFGQSDHITLCAVNLAFAMRDWPSARARLAQVGPETFASNVEFRLKQFEYYCFTGDMTNAGTALSDLGPVSDLPRRFVYAVLKYHAERGDWTEVFELAMQSLDSNLDSQEMAFLIMRAIRKTGGHAQVLKRIDDMGLTTISPLLRKLRIAVKEDTADDELKLAAIYADEQPEDFAAIRQRLLLKRLVFSNSNAGPLGKKKFVIYYCTNSSYLGPCFVSLMSLVNSNRDLIEDSDLVVIVDDVEACRIAFEIAPKLSQALGIESIRVISREEIMDPSVSLRTSYGLFTGGQSLAEAAYYRIYFADKLQKQGEYERALYIDADTIVCGDLNPLFNGVLAAALMARYEVSRPEVDAAIRTHKLKPGQYFNSGVLMFDLRHAELGSALERSLHAVHNLRTSLIFQDQCALNLGFKDVFAPLDDRFNFFVTPHDPRPSSAGAILHFLDRPKPWDPIYDGALCRLWFLHWQRLANAVGRQYASALYRMANEC
ncbi:MAG TPA: glycosyltransferase [Rhizomicrobium sp.]|jgi:lipopolysaccharide biosynthesis glycosyltransferase|nr:glycosyltransferase [Rhizomicrobium sp.]